MKKIESPRNLCQFVFILGERIELETWTAVKLRFCPWYVQSLSSAHATLPQSLPVLVCARAVGASVIWGLSCVAALRFELYR
ncbi:hypothetical protein NEOLEDRAFT_1136262 [Neolentinus lepideus HHB14362 ss-1]|uniref:Uncharacterized protein n=1 Tax=Neolentinus lepideus HHB14362 ss-1 TaxID=1314782 RepID=A0A165R9U0_9AGAM|nr:hypothetical protein NEOLEDRAFT_1136262 [Neolentinus lepideus HHB14362 ss-1]